MGDQTTTSTPIPKFSEMAASPTKKPVCINIVNQLSYAQVTSTNANQPITPKTDTNQEPIRKQYNFHNSQVPGPSKQMTLEIEDLIYPSPPKNPVSSKPLIYGMEKGKGKNLGTTQLTIRTPQPK
jgi:hypothetical protein